MTGQMASRPLTLKAAKPGSGWLAQRGITNPKGGSPWQVILVLIGFLITIAALTPGAQFWFGLLVKLNSLRASGPPPAGPRAR